MEGLGAKAPLVSVAMIAFLISLTGLPPTVGFYGKYLLFKEGIHSGLMWLVVIAALNSVVSLFYYFRVAKALFLAPPSLEEPAEQPVLASFLTALGFATVIFGLWVQPMQRWVEKSLDILTSKY